MLNLVGGTVALVGVIFRCVGCGFFGRQRLCLGWNARVVAWTVAGTEAIIAKMGQVSFEGYCRDYIHCCSYCAILSYCLIV